MAQGTLALVLELHHRLPGPGGLAGDDWATAAVERYWPLAQVIDGLSRSGLDDVLTLAISPSWTALAADPDARTAVRARLDALAADSESDPTGGMDALRQFAVDRWGEDPLAPLRAASDRGLIRLISGASSQAWLPSVAGSPLIARAQVGLAAADHAARFGSPAQGIWLPHLAYAPGIEGILGESRLRFTAVSSHDFVRGTARPPRGPFEVMVTPPGVAVFAVDAEPGRQLLGYVDGEAPPGSKRSRSRAEAFVKSWRGSVAERAGMASGPEGTSPPISLMALSIHDLEPAGVSWLADLIPALAGDSEWPITTPERFLDHYPDGPLGRPGMTVGGWLAARPAGSDLLDRVRDLAERLSEALDGPAAATSMGRRGLSQAVRELLLSQSLDWGISPAIAAETAMTQAGRRLDRVGVILSRLGAGLLDPATVAAMEAGPSFLPEIDLGVLRQP